MKLLLFVVLPICFILTGCAFNSMEVFNTGAGTVTCYGAVAKPVDVGTTLQANVPLQRSTVANPTQTVTPK